MQNYISLLRGINVSGRKLIKMDALRKSYESIGFNQVHSYLQSGNVLFRAESADTDEMQQRISRQIEKDFGFSVAILVLGTEELHKIIEGNPFSRDKEKDTAFFYVSFLSAVPQKIDYNSIEAKKLSGEEIIIAGKVIYFYCPKGYGQTKLNNNFLEAKCGVAATTRNWKTTLALCGLARELKDEADI